MSNSIPGFAQRAALLHNLLEAAYQNEHRRTKRSIKNILLTSIGWSNAHSYAFHGLQQQLQAMITTAHRNPALRLRVCTDANNHFLAVAVTQCDRLKLKDATRKQNHEPLVFHSSRFSTAQIHWTAYEKEAFAMVQTF